MVDKNNLFKQSLRSPDLWVVGLSDTAMAQTDLSAKRNSKYGVIMQRAQSELLAFAGTQNDQI
jgi:hypothetical protein